MKKRILLFSMFCFVLNSIIAQIPAGYYNNASGLSGNVLRDTLRRIITSGHVKLSYTPGVWNAYAYTDVKPSPNNTTIWDMYSDIPGGSNYTYTVFDGQCGNASFEGDCYSREHCLPKSWWGGTGISGSIDPQYTDLHHLFPSDQYVNNRKSNYPVAKVGTATWTSSNGSKLGNCNYPGGYTGTVFEPIDAYKGDFARAYLYLATRYLISSWVTGTPGTDAQFVISPTGNNYQNWYINMLLEWNANDPVSTKELNRNDSIYYKTPQHNRNPFVDHPEYVSYIWGGQTPVIKPQPDNHVTNLQLSNGNPNYSTINVSWSDATGTVIPDGYVVKISSVSFSDIIAPIDGQPETASSTVKIINPGSQFTSFTGLNPNTVYFVKIFPFTNTLSNINYKTDGVVPNASISTTYYSWDEGFETGLSSIGYPTGIQNYTLTSGIWSILNVMRNSTNKHSGSYCAQIKSELNSNATTPSLNTAGTLTFWCVAGTPDVNGLKIQKSVNGGAFTDVQIYTISTTLTQFTCNVNEAASDVKIRFLNMAVQTLYLDDISITNFSSQINIGSLNSFGNQTINTTSAEQSYTVSGSNLSTNNIVITPPVGYEISLTSGSGFVANPNSITLTSISGTVTSTTIFVRFKPTLVQQYYGNISHICASATTQNLSVSGLGADLAAPIANSATNVNSSGFTANWDAVTDANSYKLDVSTSATFESNLNTNDLLFSEYLEGSSNNKYIEIYNGTGNTINLADYKLQLFSNGTVTPTSDITLSGNLTNGSTIVYKNTSATIYLGTSTANSAINFNGDDAIALYKISTSSYIDIFGRIGEDPGTAWTSVSLTTLDKTLVRKSTVTVGVTTNPASGFPTLATEWDQYSIDVTSNLGTHTYTATTPSFVSVYNDLTVGSTSTVVSNLSPNTTYYYRVRSSNASNTSVNSSVIATTISNGVISWSGLAGVGSTSNVNVISGSTLTISSPAQCNNLTIQNGGMVTINSGNTLTPTGTLTIEDGGSLIDLATQTLTATMKRIVPAYTNAANGWHLIGSPVDGLAIASTSFAPTYGIDDFFIFDETQAVKQWINYFGVNSSTLSFENFEKGKGYLVAYSNANSTTRSFSGVLNNTDVTGIQITNTGTTPAGIQGWNLVGNPFPSALDWAYSGWSKGNAEGQAQIWDDASSNYINVVNHSNIIPANQGFFVFTSTGGTFNIPAAARVHQSQSLYKSSQNNDMITLKVSNNQNNGKDIANIVFNNNATNAYDSDFEGTELKGSAIAPQLYSVLSTGKKLSTNAIPYPNNSTIVNLGFTAGVNGQYTITASNLGVLSMCTSVTLEDLKTNTTQNLIQNPVYNFTAATTDNANRFVLHFAVAVGVNENDKPNAGIYAYDNNIYVNTSETIKQINIYNALGQLVKTVNTVNGLQKINMNENATGCYIVRVVTDKNAYSEKVLVK